MHLIDWLIMTLPLLICLGIALYTRRYVGTVADFMAGGRNAGRFLISTARTQQAAGAVVFVALFQVFYVSGFTLNWWSQIYVPVAVIVAISGFVIYRYRQTRALTLAQFFEMRYSRKFRLFTGALAFVAGLMNFGIIPVIGARFMVFFLGLPQFIHLFSLTIPTYLALMFCFLTTCVLMTTAAGQVTVLVTDCTEGMFSQILYVFIVIALLFSFFNWSESREALLSAKPGESLVNPFDSFGLKDFNVWYILIATCLDTYATMAWQNSHAFNASGANPHEARMGNILGQWRTVATTLMVTLLGFCALTYLRRPDGHKVVTDTLAHISNPSIVDQMRIPVALSHLLPIGIKGALASICLMGIISGESIHLHSWGSIFIQDVVLPLRKTPLSPRNHIILLRLAIIGVAAWAFLFGALFPQTQYINMWFFITQAIFTGGAGAAIIGGLYWSRGTAAGAWTGMLVGSVLSVGGIGLQIWYQHIHGREFPLNGQEIAFIAALLGVTGYGVVSWLTCRKPHNMDRLLHRGIYTVAADAVPGADLVSKKVPIWYRLMGIDEMFSRSDRWITIGIFAWIMMWVFIFVFGSLAYLIHPWSDTAWANYWIFTAVAFPLVVGSITAVWFTIGCFQDLRVFFRRLREERFNPHDDGTVSASQNMPHPLGIESLRSDPCDTTDRAVVKTILE